jgi:hypothetical protein
MAMADPIEAYREHEEESYHYDNQGRMKFHPEFHFSHGEPFSESDKEYMCKFWDVDEVQTIAFALGKTEATVRAKVAALNKIGLFEYYRNRNKDW